MNELPDGAPVTLSISAVERDTGVAKDTLRVWERRYGFPDPERDSFGERQYSLEQVDKLRLIRRLLDLGHRPGRIVRCSIDDLQALAAEKLTSSVPTETVAWPNSVLDELLSLLQAHEVGALRLQLAQKMLHLGLERFVVEVAAPLNDKVSEAWARGRLAIFEEHLFSESMHVVMRNAIASVPPQSATGPCVLLTTFPSEPHGIGLLMAEALLALNGCRCISLGPQTPVHEIALAARELQADIVLLWFASVSSPSQLLEGVVELRDKLAGSGESWLAGRCQNLARRQPAGVRALDSLSAISVELKRWHRDQSKG